MEICRGGKGVTSHLEVCYEEKGCPLCEIRDELMGEIADLKGEIANMERTIESLEEEITP